MHSFDSLELAPVAEHQEKGGLIMRERVENSLEASTSHLFAR